MAFSGSVGEDGSDSFVATALFIFVQYAETSGQILMPGVAYAFGNTLVEGNNSCGHHRLEKMGK